MGDFSLSCYPIDFKPWHNDSKILKFYTMSCSSGFVQDFLDHYVDGFRSNDVDVGISRLNES